MGFFWGLVSGIALIGCGALCLPALIIKKRPDAKEIIEKIIPYQGWIGIIISCIGIFLTIFWLFYTSAYVSRGIGGFVWWISNIAANLLAVTVGFLLGFAMIRNKILKNASDEIRSKADELHMKLVAVQTPLGIACIIVGAWTLIYVILFSLVFWR